MAGVVVYLSPITALLPQILNNQGVVAAGAQVFTYVAGSVSTLQTTYSDSTGLVQNPNPLTANAAGRIVSASGAPVSFWQISGTLIKVVVKDAQGNVLLGPIDNIPGIGDLSFSTQSLQALLANPASSNQSQIGPVGGADYVANAVKSYDVFASVRAANVPTLIAGQTLILEIEGGTAVGDGLGGQFYWAILSTATDDGRNVLKPGSVNPIGAGRWLRLFGLGIPLILVKPVDQQTASNTSNVVDANLITALAAGATYLVSLRLQLLGSGGTGQGWKAGLTYSGSLPSITAGSGSGSGNGTPVAINAVVSGGNASNAALSSTVGDAVNLDFVLITGTAGSLAVVFAQNSSSANPTIMKTGSTMTVTRVA